MMWLLWLVVSCLLGYVTLCICYIAVMRAYVVWQSGVRINLFWKIPIAVGYYVGKGLDIVWNVIVGTIAFREFPRETLFTSRCKRHKQKPIGDWRGDRARWWCDQMEIFHEGHCS